MSYKSTIALVNQLGMDHDKKILDWKSQLETKLSNSQVSFGILKYCINILHVYIAGNFHRYNFCVCVRIIHKKNNMVYSRTPLGLQKVSDIKRCPYFRG